MIIRFATLISLLTILAACQSVQYGDLTAVLNQVNPRCHQLITEFRSQVDSAGVANAGTRPIAGFPLIHIDRFLDGVAQHINNEQQLTAWLEFATTLSLQTRAIENVNLSTPWNETELNSLAECNQLAASNDSYRSALLNHINDRSSINNHYMTSRQWLGIYPLMRPFYLRSIHSLQLEEKQWFEEPENFVRSNHYIPIQIRQELSTMELSNWFTEALSSNSLAIPVLAEEQLLRLFQHHAPDLEIEYTGNQDLLGSPTWSGNKLSLDTTNPQTYIVPSYTNFAGKNLLQLNYIFWFSERQSRRFIDLYSGPFDGFIWRVTLDHRGQVLLYDSIHPCGCYHKYFVKSDQVGILESPRSKEPANIFRVRELDRNSPITISLTSNEHYVVGLTNSASPAIAEASQYPLIPYATLSKLDNSGQAKSMFDHRGLVFDSERLERFILWPTGILSVGAMRQWGTHATGFIEEQQFDDFNLFDLYFDYEE